jgi:hypothetical protein
MRIQAFSAFQELAKNGMVDPLKCFNKEHVNPLVPALNKKDEVYLWCLECDFKLNPGINLYEQIVSSLEEHIEDCD